MVTRTIRLRDGTVLRVAAHQDRRSADAAGVTITLAAETAAGAARDDGIAAAPAHGWTVDRTPPRPGAASPRPAMAAMFRLLASPRAPAARCEETSQDRDEPAETLTAIAPAPRSEPRDLYAEPFLLGLWPC